jgi:hypothetical protein
MRENWKKVVNFYILTTITPEPGGSIPLNRSSKNSEIWAIIVSQQKSPEPHESSAEFYQTFKELTAVLVNLLHKILREGMLPNSFYDIKTGYGHNEKIIDVVP